MRSRRPAAGFTMLELMIGVLIVGVALLYTYDIFVAGMGDIGRSRDYSNAVMLASEIVEGARVHAFDRLSKEDPVYGADGAPTGAKVGAASFEADSNADSGDDDRFPKTVKLGRITFTRSCEIADVKRAGAAGGGNRPPNLKSIKVEVAWKNEKGQPLSYVLSTLIGRSQ